MHFQEPDNVNQECIYAKEQVWAQGNFEQKQDLSGNSEGEQRKEKKADDESFCHDQEGDFFVGVPYVSVLTDGSTELVIPPKALTSTTAFVLALLDDPLPFSPDSFLGASLVTGNLLRFYSNGSGKYVIVVSDVRRCYHSSYLNYVVIHCPFYLLRNSTIDSYIANNGTTSLSEFLQQTSVKPWPFWSSEDNPEPYYGTRNNTIKKLGPNSHLVTNPSLVFSLTPNLAVGKIVTLLPGDLGDIYLSAGAGCHIVVCHGAVVRLVTNDAANGMEHLYFGFTYYLETSADVSFKIGPCVKIRPGACCHIILYSGATFNSVKYRSDASSDSLAVLQTNLSTVYPTNFLDSRLNPNASELYPNNASASTSNLKEKINPRRNLMVRRLYSQERMNGSSSVKRLKTTHIFGGDANATDGASSET